LRGLWGPFFLAKNSGARYSEMVETKDPRQQLVKLAQWKMPFGRYEGWLLADLPENYLLWMKQAGFPAGELGDLLALLLEMKTNGLEHLLRPLRPKGLPKGM
jgi:uncharacterized protein (DUF3820 family)